MKNWRMERNLNVEEFCKDKWVEHPVYFVTRYEYANMYHTMTDFWNLWITAYTYGVDTSKWQVCRSPPRRICYRSTNELINHSRVNRFTFWMHICQPSTSIKRGKICSRQAIRTKVSTSYPRPRATCVSGTYTLLPWRSVHCTDTNRSTKQRGILWSSGIHLDLAAEPCTRMLER